MPDSAYEETLNYLFSQLPMFSRIGPAAYKKDLTNTLTLCNFLGNPQTKFPSIHIAGTNGKGSVSHFLASVFGEAGYKTGLYTSPHIHDFRERIKVNGLMAEKDFIVEFVRKTKGISAEINPSFFELTVAMAFEYFAISKVDLAIIETGLGGRLDSTNVIIPELSVITNISFDHVNMLGNTLQKIAFEKAGIIKKNIPVVIGQTLPETKPVFLEKANQLQSDIIFAESKWSFISQHGNTFQFQNPQSGEKKSFNSGLMGMYQQYNIPIVLTAVEIMKKMGWNLQEDAVQNGILNVNANTGIEGRWQKIQENPSIILDVAHNEDGIRQVLLQLEAEFPNCRWHFVLGFVNDKPLEKLLSILPPNSLYYFTQAHILRAMEASILQQQASGFGLKGNAFENVNVALSSAKKNAAKEDVIIVCGSFFVIAEVN